MDKADAPKAYRTLRRHARNVARFRSINRFETAIFFYFDLFLAYVALHFPPVVSVGNQPYTLANIMFAQFTRNISETFVTVMITNLTPHLK